MSTGDYPRRGAARPHALRHARYVERGEVPGIVTLICRHGEPQVSILISGARPIRRSTTEVS